MFVRENRRGRGIGGDLLRALARVAHERGYARIEWSVLKWNKPAIGFYEHIGAEVQDDWDTYRLTGHELTAFARSADAAF
ncbi:GNAT family N-acetyltransferase [Corynebacterium phoceense]|uniref:GNAT family N-acetyltransferase n=1 Tax=Corynebacterium phoceense TaxID=1686286 RepID=UPI00211B97B3|nr:GNAT family N-acetyltransferase [Corynebacterium phoceense]